MGTGVEIGNHWRRTQGRRFTDILQDAGRSVKTMLSLVAHTLIVASTY